ncbi:DUF3618 domain-containing protein [Falsiroseomonas sp.]|uniref:DUF3618 domain-containing protein n=1 Tax=Falsiroseomonas sp. TaxID=2870721 RepID=UPI002718F623|nr:DUF3618 domain-containing protein [Falsiroseomonas sp.]MDO9502811.1 DUF3618 domain-containing protein [Falsiroseomonas sp.]
MSSTTNPDKRSSAEIEQEVEQTRAGLTETLEELRDRASPGQLFEQALDYAKTSGGAEFTRNLGAAVRDNPLPLLLIGAGIGWMMLSQGGSRPALRRRSGAYDAPYGATYPGTGWEREEPGMLDRAGEAVGDAVGGAADAVRGAARSATDAASSAYRSAAGAVGAAGERLGEAAGSARNSLRGGSGQASHMASDYADRASRAASGYSHDARDRIGHWADEAESTAGWVLREQPLVLGALGIALGAAVGALLPGTEAEDRMMGETRDELAGKASALAQEGYEKARDTVSGQADQARDAAGSAAGLAGQAREAVRGAAHSLAANAKEALAETPEPANEPRPEGTPPRPETRPATGLG